MSEKEQTIFENIDLCGAMKNTQITPYTFISKAYNSIKIGDYKTARLWIEHAEKFRSFFSDNLREGENFQSVLSMTMDFLLLVKNTYYPKERLHD
jgi:hypothetical protein